MTMKTIFDIATRDNIIQRIGLLTENNTSNWGKMNPADKFVVNQNLVLRMSICDKNRQLIVAAKRYSQCKK